MQKRELSSRPVHRRILLVDDDAGECAAHFVTFWSKRGYVVILAVDGQQALETIVSSSIDLVILDLNMPRKNGLGHLRAPQRRASAHARHPHHRAGRTNSSRRWARVWVRCWDEALGYSNSARNHRSVARRIGRNAPRPACRA